SEAEIVEQVEALDLGTLKSEEAELIQAEQALLAKVSDKPQGEVVPVSDSNSHDLLEETAQIESDGPIVEDQLVKEVEEETLPRASLHLTVQDSVDIEKARTEDVVQHPEVKAETGVRSLPQDRSKRPEIKRVVYYYDDNYDVARDTMIIRAKQEVVRSNEPEQSSFKTAGRDLGMVDSEARGKLNPDFFGTSTQEIEQQIRELQWKIERMEQERSGRQNSAYTQATQVLGRDVDLTNVAVAKRQGIVAYDGLPLRIAPGLLNPKIRRMVQGEQVVVQYGQDGWYRVQTRDGILAWVEEAGIRLQ
ncbi:MAG: SH3 domain-containing protein, partial [Bdellovibrionales bacterium]|nr:SH3 domain-containing protein [Bdellovibrionales bacterium]